MNGFDDQAKSEYQRWAQKNIGRAMIAYPMGSGRSARDRDKYDLRMLNWQGLAVIRCISSGTNFWMERGSDLIGKALPRG